MPLRTRITRPLSLLLTTALSAVTLTGCALLDAATADCEGTAVRVKEVAALGILDSRPAKAALARGLEKVDAGCWADSGDVVVYAGQIYAYSGTQADLEAHYRAAAEKDGWSPEPGSEPKDMFFVKGNLNLSIGYLTDEDLADAGHGSRPDLTGGAGYSLYISTYVNDES